MAFILCILSWKECNRVRIQRQELHRLNLPIPLSPLCILQSILSLPHKHTHLSQSVSILSFVVHNQESYRHAFVCVCVRVHNMLLYFIAYTYFTTFPALELEEDQTSSIINFLPEHNLESMPHRKPYTHTWTHADAHTHTGWDGKGEERAPYIYIYISSTNKDFNFSIDYF